MGTCLKRTLGAMFLFCFAVQYAFAGEIDLLLNKLVEKGVLSAGEAQAIATETKEQIKSEIAQAKSETLPQWLQQVKLKGDMRLRYEWDKDKTLQDQSRARIRARLGVESKINNQLKMGVGIATGTTGDPRSRNITLGNSSSANTPGSSKDIVLDYAYGQWTPNKYLSIIGGKFQNNLWQPHDVFWKGDITPDGAGVNLAYQFNQKLNFFMNNLMFVLKNDSRTDKQPFMAALQPGFTYAITDTMNLKSALTYYKFQSVKAAQKFSYSKSGSSPYLLSGNTLIGGRYAYNYDAIQPSVELSFIEPFQGLVPYASVFGDYMRNVSGLENKTGLGGFDAGVKFGYEKVSDWKQWQTKLVYSKLGRDSWLDIFTDSDRYGGTTNSKAFEGVFEFG
ncbi:MAG TPA: putative porin, partial [Candidatus Omnitrophota bacterium]|nr:putative porin [Candidatus Omnitrophota bacterium]